MQKKTFGLTGNQLKILALVAMTCDHVGLQILPQFPILRIIGRLAFPIFAYMIGEGARYTRNRGKYLGMMAAVALLCQVVYFVAMGSLYMCVLVTFSLSVALIYVTDRYLKTRKPLDFCLTALTFCGILFLCLVLPKLLPETDFYVDYSIWGVLFPVFVYYSKGKYQKLLSSCAVLVILGIQYSGIQWFGLLALIPLALYNGQRGKWKMKYLFYVYYPAHLALIYLISLI